MKKIVVITAVLVLLAVLLSTTQVDFHFPIEAKDKFPVQGDIFVKLYEDTFKFSVFIMAEDKNIGSGIVWTKDGYILTNARVVMAEKKVVVYLDERTHY